MEPFIVADSGGTHTTWCIVPGEGPAKCRQSSGLHPNILSGSQMREILQTVDGLHEFSGRLFFYGAACIHPAAVEKVNSALRWAMPKARITVAHDLLAVCRAMLGRESGFCGILGTGANTCWYNGDRITENRLSTGYILGDEGSGAYLGKLLLKAMFNDQLPQVVADGIMRHYNAGSPADVVHKLYASEAPNRFLASGAKVVADYRELPQVRALIEHNFHEFFRQMVCCYSKRPKKVALIGGIAQHFKPEILKVGEAYGVVQVDTADSPMQGLIAYHRNQPV